MSQLRLLASSLFASAIIFPAAAQSVTTPSPTPLLAAIATPSILTLDTNAAPSTTSPRSVTPLAPGTFTLKSSDGTRVFNITAGKPLKISKDDEIYLKLHKGDVHAALHNSETLLSQAQSPCLTLRTYNFTARDLKSPNPRPSSETDCTPASRGHLLDLPATSAKSPVAISIQAPATPK